MASDPAPARPVFPAARGYHVQPAMESAAVPAALTVVAVVVLSLLTRTVLRPAAVAGDPVSRSGAALAATGLAALAATLVVGAVWWQWLDAPRRIEVGADGTMEVIRKRRPNAFPASAVEEIERRAVVTTDEDGDRSTRRELRMRVGGRWMVFDHDRFPDAGRFIGHMQALNPSVRVHGAWDWWD
ncbi:MAG: hypothetical protein ACR2OO_12070 [Thermomicrobiales bacterium]